jgi:hypothetical protein
MRSMNRRVLWSIAIAAIGCAGLAVLDRTAYASWAERITVALLFAAAIVIVWRNGRDGR